MDEHEGRNPRRQRPDHGPRGSQYNPLLHWTLREAVRAATLNPSRAVGLAQHGELAPGAEANIIVLSPDGEVRRTIVRGHC